MTLLKEFQNRNQKKPTKPATKILFGILDDLTSRKAFWDVWDVIDDEIKEELLAENFKIIIKNLP